MKLAYSLTNTETKLGPRVQVGDTCHAIPSPSLPPLSPVFPVSSQTACSTSQAKPTERACHQVQWLPLPSHWSCRARVPHLPQLKPAFKETIIPTLFFMVLYKILFTAAIKTICVNIIFMAEWYASIWLHHHLLNYYSVVGYLGCFLFFIIMNRVIISLLKHKKESPPWGEPWWWY